MTLKYLFTRSPSELYPHENSKTEYRGGQSSPLAVPFIEDSHSETMNSQDLEKLLPQYVELLQRFKKSFSLSTACSTEFIMTSFPEVLCYCQFCCSIHKTNPGCCCAFEKNNQLNKTRLLPQGTSSIATKGAAARSLK